MLLYRPSYCRFLCSSFRFQHLSHFVGCGFRGTLLEKAGHHKNRVPYADFRHAVGGCGAFHAVFDMLFFIGHRQTPFNRSSACFQPFQLLLCAFPCGNSRRSSRQGYTSLLPGHKSGRVGCVRRDSATRSSAEVGRDDQRLFASVTTVNHIVDLL